MDHPSEDLRKHFSKIIDFMKGCIKDGGKVFVHCYAGRSRSATSVIAYLMQEEKMDFYTAARFVKKCRPCIFPNPGFQRQLMQFDQ